MQQSHLKLLMTYGARDEFTGAAEIKLTINTKAVDEVSIMCRLKNLVPCFGNMLRKLSWTRGKGLQKISKKKKQKKVGIFIDNELGQDKVDELRKALVGLTRQTSDDFNNVVIECNSITDLTKGPKEWAKKHKIADTDLIVITRDEEQKIKVLEDLKDKANITKINDTAFKDDEYYPLFEIVYFTLMRCKALKFSKKDLIEFYKSMPNVQPLGDDEIESYYCNKEKKTISITLAIPDAERLSVRSQFYEAIAEYIETHA